MNPTAKQILELTPNTNHSLSIILSVIIIIYTFTCVILIEYGIRKQIIQTEITAPWIPRTFQGILSIICILAGIYLASGIQTIQIAKNHGIYQDNMTWNKVITGIENSPEEDKLPENLSNILILYYKFGCEDCEAIYQKEQTTFKNLEQVYWISTRSEQGETLRKTYPVTEVPAGVYITDNLKPVVCNLFLKKQGKIILHEENAQLLLSLYQSSHNEPEN